MLRSRLQVWEYKNRPIAGLGALAVNMRRISHSTRNERKFVKADVDGNRNRLCCQCAVLKGLTACFDELSFLTGGMTNVPHVHCKSAQAGDGLSVACGSGQWASRLPQHSDSRLHKLYSNRFLGENQNKQSSSALC